MMLTLTCSTAYADSNDDTSAPVSDAAYLTDIGGYACYQRDGNYWTVIDGEEYLVIDTRPALKTTNAQNITVKAQNNSLPFPTGWGNDTYYGLLADGSSYTGDVNLSKGDYYSPIFEVNPEFNDFRFQISSNHFIGNYNYKFYFYYHHKSPINQWDPEYASVSFGWPINTKVLIPGTASGIIDGLGVNILKEGSSSINFKLTITPQ